MELSKNTIKGLGALTLVGIFAASGFFVVKPQIEGAMELSSQTADAEDLNEMRQLRLVKLQTESENIDTLTAEVNDLLLRIPSEKNVTDIAGAVIEAMPPGVRLESFRHGALEVGAPAITLPEASITDTDPFFELVDPNAAPAAPEEDAEEGEEDAAPAREPEPTADEVVPALATAPFILTVRASSYESLTNFIDIMQFQKRLLVVGAVESSAEDGGEINATIYAYAFANNTPAIAEWESVDAEEAE